jgi:hypothetical protein
MTKNPLTNLFSSVIILMLVFWLPPVLAVDAEEAFKQGKSYYNQNDFTQAASWFHKAASLGHANAQSLIGSMSLIGKGIPRDTRLAIYWLKRAAKQGHVEAQSLLGAIYLVGKDTPQDLVQAELWLRKSSEQGLADAQYLLGVMYYQGQGVPQNRAFAHRLLSLAAAQGHQGAIAALPPTVETQAPPPPQKIKGKYRLTVNAIPYDSRIRIMNITPKYRPGITLKPGKYDIYVTHPEYFSKRKWVTLTNADLSIDVILDEK